ncbi:MAG: DinB family protein [Bacteroidia bacterium]
MLKSEILKMPNYFDRYINLVEESDVIAALEKYGPAWLEKEKANFEKLGDKVYAPGKWTIKDILQHIIDAERVFAYRALRFARNDKTQLHGFDEDHFAAHANTKNRSIADLLDEFKLLRSLTIVFYKALDKETQQREGIASGNKISVLALGFTIAGHAIHHMNVVKERYYKMLK